MISKIPLTEGAETRNMKVAKYYLYEKMGYNEQQSMKCIGNIKTNIPNSQLAKCKFMLAMVRMFCDGEFDDGQIIMDVNKSLNLAASEAHVNEYNQDLNGLTAQQFIDKFSTSIQQDLEQDKSDVSSQQYDSQNSQYQIVKITSFEEAEEYGDYVDWCVTHYDDMFDSYTNHGNGIFYFCLRNGWQEEPEEKGENCPLDSYGLSMIAVSINNDGSCNTITCRWNHANGGNDNIISPKKLSEIIGYNFCQVFKPLTKEEIRANMSNKLLEIQDEVEYMLRRDDIESFTDPLTCDPDYGNKNEITVFSYRAENGSYVLLNEDGSFFIEMIFDDINERKGDIINVQSGGKWNCISVNTHNLISWIWFNRVMNYFNRGFAIVERAKRYNIIDKQGNIMLSEWFEAINPQYAIQNAFVDNNGNGKGKLEVQQNKKTNFYNLATKKLIFNKNIDYFFNVNTNLFIRFEGESFIQDYDPKTFRLKAPFKVNKLLGYRGVEVNGKYVSFYEIELIDGKKYFIDNKANLYTNTPYENGGPKMIQPNLMYKQTESQKRKMK